MIYCLPLPLLKYDNKEEESVVERNDIRRVGKVGRVKRGRVKRGQVKRGRGRVKSKKDL